MTEPVYVHLPADRPTPVLDLGPFRALIVVEMAVSDAWRRAVSAWLVAGGCLYMSAWGQDCAAWDDSVDWANIAACGDGEIPDERLVLTTWHDGETLAEACRFAAFVAVHPTVDLSTTVIVHIAPDPCEAELRQLFEAARRQR